MVGEEQAPTSRLWAIVQAHMDAYGVREAELARRMGTSPQTLNSWKNRGVRSLPSRRLLEALAREARVPYEEVLHAALVDTAYAPGQPRPKTVIGFFDEPRENAVTVEVLQNGRKGEVRVSRTDGKKPTPLDVVRAIEEANNHPEQMFEALLRHFGPEAIQEAVKAVAAEEAAKGEALPPPTEDELADSLSAAAKRRPGSRQPGQ